MVREESHARIMAGIEGLPAYNNTTSGPSAPASLSSSKDQQHNNNKTKVEGSPSVATESGAMADIN